MVASPDLAAAVSNSPQVALPAAVAVPACGPTVTLVIRDRSMTMPPSLTACPPTPCPPPRIVAGNSCSRANLDREHDIRRTRAAGNEGGTPVDSAVPHQPGGVVSVVCGQQQAAAELLAQPGKSGSGDRGRCRRRHVFSRRDGNRQNRNFSNITSSPYSASAATDTTMTSANTSGVLSEE